jgi:hypothetical protein
VRFAPVTGSNRWMRVGSSQRAASSPSVTMLSASRLTISWVRASAHHGDAVCQCDRSTWSRVMYMVVPSRLWSREISVRTRLRSLASRFDIGRRRGRSRRRARSPAPSRAAGAGRRRVRRACGRAARRVRAARRPAGHGRAPHGRLRSPQREPHGVSAQAVGTAGPRVPILSRVWVGSARLRGAVSPFSHPGGGTAGRGPARIRTLASRGRAIIWRVATAALIAEGHDACEHGDSARARAAFDAALAGPRGWRNAGAAGTGVGSRGRRSGIH